MLRMALRHAGFEVDEADTAADAVKRLEGGGLSGVVLDFSLPDKGSGDVLAWLIAHSESPPWLVLVAKPFDPWVLIERIKAMAERDGGG